MRARNLKPGLFKNEVLGTADPFLTVLFEGLWCLADKLGRLEDRPLRIKAEVFPYRENIDVNGYLTELERMGFIQRYESADLRLIQVTKFSEHQNPHHTEKKSTYPAHVINNGELTVKEPSVTSDTPADSLIPDSLIPDTSVSVPVVRFKLEEFDGGEAFEELCQAYARAERSQVASTRYLEAVEWCVKQKQISRKEAADYIRERAKLYCSSSKFQKGLTKWLEEKIFEQHESAWVDTTGGRANGQNQHTGTTPSRQTARNDSNREKIARVILGISPDAVRDAAHGSGTIEVRTDGIGDQVLGPSSGGIPSKPH